jgi:hypothetical protein
MRNTYDHQPTAPHSSPPSPEKRPFMQSLTSMHHGMSEVEYTLAERKKRAWLDALAEQVRTKEAQRESERAVREIEELKEELRAAELRESADAALRADLRASAGGRPPKNADK